MISVVRRRVPISIPLEVATSGERRERVPQARELRRRGLDRDGPEHGRGARESVGGIRRDDDLLRNRRGPGKRGMLARRRAADRRRRRGARGAGRRARRWPRARRARCPTRRCPRWRSASRVPPSEAALGAVDQPLDVGAVRVRREGGVAAAAATTSASGAWTRRRIASGRRHAAVIDPSETNRVAATTRTKAADDREHGARARGRRSFRWRSRRPCRRGTRTRPGRRARGRPRRRPHPSQRGSYVTAFMRKTAATPLPMSRSIVPIARAFPAVRRTFVAPALPEPCVRTSTPRKRRTRTIANGTEPSR